MCKSIFRYHGQMRECNRFTRNLVSLILVLTSPRLRREFGLESHCCERQSKTRSELDRKSNATGKPMSQLQVVIIAVQASDIIR